MATTNPGTNAPTANQVADAVSGLRGWRGAGEQYANRGGSLIPLDGLVDIVLDELEWRRSPEDAAEDDIERPDPDRLQAALDGIAAHFDDGPLGEDLKTVHAALANGRPEGMA